MVICLNAQKQIEIFTVDINNLNLMFLGQIKITA